MPQTHSTSHASQNANTIDWFTLQTYQENPKDPPTYWWADETTGLISAKPLPSTDPVPDNFKFSMPNDFSIFSKSANKYVGPGSPGSDGAETGFLYANFEEEYDFTKVDSNGPYTVFSFQVYYTEYVYCADGKNVLFAIGYENSPAAKFTRSFVS